MNAQTCGQHKVLATMSRSLVARWSYYQLLTLLNSTAVGRPRTDFYIVRENLANLALATEAVRSIWQAGVCLKKNSAAANNIAAKVKLGAVWYLLRPPTQSVALPTRGISCATNASSESSVSLPLTNSKSGIVTCPFQT